MIIHLQAPKNSVTDWAVNYLSKKLFALHRKHPEISSANVYLRTPSKVEKLCSVGLHVRGVSLLVSRSAHSFSKASFHVLIEMEQRLKQFFINPVRKQLAK